MSRRRNVRPLRPGNSRDYYFGSYGPLWVYAKYNNGKMPTELKLKSKLIFFKSEYSTLLVKLVGDYSLKDGLELLRNNLCDQHLDMFNDRYYHFIKYKMEEL